MERGGKGCLDSSVPGRVRGLDRIITEGTQSWGPWYREVAREALLLLLIDRGRDPACIPAPLHTQKAIHQKQTDPRPEGRRWDQAHPRPPAGSGASDKPGPARGRARGCPLSGYWCACRDKSARPSLLPPDPRAEGSPGPATGPRPPPPASPPPPSCSPDPSITAAASRRVRPGRLRRAPVT